MSSSNVDTLEAQPVAAQPASELIYKLDDKPPVFEAIFVAFQHVLASFVGVITPPLIICSTLGIDATETSHTVSMALLFSGIGTFIQAKRIGPIGSGLLSLQGTSFSFLGAIVGVGTAAMQSGKSPQQALALIFGVCFFGSFVEIFLSRFLHLTQKIVTPVVSGTVVMLIGLSLVKTGIISMAGGLAAQQDGSFGSLQNLGLSGLVLAVILLLNATSSRFLRMGAIAIGLGIGYAISLLLHKVDFSGLQDLPLVNIPVPFRYGLDFDVTAFIPFLLLYVLTTLETIGDLTATSAASGEPVEGQVYLRRLKGGVLGDGVNSMIAALFNAFPNTTFSQNNGVIQMTGVGSRYVGFYISGIFMLLGLLPLVGGVLQTIPQPVLGGATIVMFGTIAVAGIDIIASTKVDRRTLIIVAASLALGIGVVYVPEILDDKPAIIRNIFSSGIATGGLTAMLLNWFFPREDAAEMRSGELGSSESRSGESRSGK